MLNSPDQNFSSANAAEVTTMLGTSVLRVDHLRTPGPVRRATPMFLIGGVLLAICIAAFASAVSTASANDQSRMLWSDSGRPSHEFRPQKVGLAYDILALGGFVGGLFAMSLAVARLRQTRTRDEFTVGHDSEADLHVGSIVGRQTLIRCGDSGPRVVVGIGAIDVVHGGQVLDPTRAAETGLIAVCHDGYAPNGDAAIRIAMGSAHVLVAISLLSGGAA